MQEYEVHDLLEFSLNGFHLKWFSLNPIIQNPKTRKYPSGMKYIPVVVILKAFALSTTSGVMSIATQRFEQIPNQR